MVSNGALVIVNTSLGGLRLMSAITWLSAPLSAPGSPKRIGAVATNGVAMKRVKAWAVVDKDGEPLLIEIHYTEVNAETACNEKLGERVVPVEIVIQEEK